MLPPMMTVSTLPMLATCTTVPTALASGNVFTSLVRMTMMSASLPGVSVPILSMSPQQPALVQRRHRGEFSQVGQLVLSRAGKAP
jgi:hypothetical protein